MTIWEKLKTGPRHTHSCRSCGRRISISRTALIAVLVPVTVGALVAHAVASQALGVAAIVLGGLAAVGVYIYAVPIIGRDG
jgi:uncharacterized membrane protein YebE (DUF533 family)